MFVNTLLAGSDIWMTVGMIAIVIAVFYFFGIRPQRKQERAAAEMRNNLMVGDEITTIGGIIGKIVSIKEETMVIETTRDHTRIRFLKSAVRSVDVRAEDAKAIRTPKAEEAEKPAAAKKPAAKKPAQKKPAAKPVTEPVAEIIQPVDEPAVEAPQTAEAEEK